MARCARRGRAAPRRRPPSKSSWASIVRAGQPSAAREARDVHVDGRPGAGTALLLDQPVHHRVPAVREDHEQRARPVVRRAPERLDAVERRAVADDRRDRPVGPSEAKAGGRRQREPEPAHRRAEKAERLARRNACAELGPVGRCLLEQDRVARQPLGDRRQNTCPARSGSPSAGGAGAAGRRSR